MALQYAAAYPFTPQTAAENAAGVAPSAIAYPPGDARRYGADLGGATDSSAALSNAIAQASQAGGADIYLPGGSFLVGNLTVNANGVKIRGAGPGLTRLLANGNGVWVLKIAQSNCSLEDLLIDGNGHSAVDGLVFAPANEAITNATNSNDYCVTRAVQVQNCNNGLRMRPGPTVTGVDSGCFYNQFFGVFFLDCVRGIWMENAVNNGRAGANRCAFVACRIGSSSTVCNTGLQIDNATTVQFFGLHCEGIANGVSPNATPTAVQIANSNSGGLNNNTNQFFGCMMEANTRDLDNANAYTSIFGGYWTATKFGGGAINPQTMIGGDPSVMPFIVPSLQHGEGVAGFPSGFLGVGEEVADFNGATYYNWQAYALTTANVTNAATVTAGSTASQYRRLSNMVSWHFTLTFKATAGATEVDITPPIAPNAALYSTIGSYSPYYTLTVYDSSGSGKQVEAGWTNAGKFYVKPSASNWSTTGNNEICAAIEYHT